MSLVSVSFHVRMPHGGVEQHVYKLGLGPCGKEVSELIVNAATTLCIIQFHTDGTRKRFVYPWAVITTKVTEEYSDDKA